MDQGHRKARVGKLNRCYLCNFQNNEIVWALCMGTDRAFYKLVQLWGKLLTSRSLSLLYGEQQIYLNL